jgi:hypothetical protein
MSRAIKNKGLAELCRLANLQIDDLRGCLRCNPRNILFYASGQRQCPRIEDGLAWIFKLEVAELRKILFGGGKVHGKRKEVGRRYVGWRYKDGRETFYGITKHLFEKFPDLRKEIEEGKGHARGASLRIRELPNGFVKWQLMID